MNNHQYYQSDEDDHNIFYLINSNEFYLHKNINSSQQADIYACIKLEKEGDYHNVIWSPGYNGFSNDKMDNFDNAIKWTAIYTHDWFLKDCIPSALEEYNFNSKSIFQHIFNVKPQSSYNEHYLTENELVKTYKQIT